MTSIYVGNLSYSTTEDGLRQAFAQFGEVSTVNVISDRETGRPRGFAFVEMPNSNEATAAINGLHEQEIDGRQITVNEAKPKTERPRSSSGGGARRGSW